MKTLKSLGAALAIIIAILFQAVPAQAEATYCSGMGLTLGGTVQYGSCASTNPSAGTVAFSSDGTVVKLTANGPSEAISFLGSNGPIAASRLCVRVFVDKLRVSTPLAATQSLAISYNGSQQPDLVWTAQRGVSRYCASIPAGASNIFWQLRTKLGGDRGFHLSTLRQTLLSVSVS